MKPRGKHYEPLLTKEKYQKIDGKNECDWFCGPLIIDVIASIAIIGEACSYIMLNGEFPHRIGFSTSDAGDPSRTEFHRHTTKTFLTDPAADSVWSLKDYYILYTVLSQHFCCGNTFKLKSEKKTQQNK